MTRWFQDLACIAIGSIGLSAQIPPPTGEYTVGRTLQHWVDSGRDDPVSEVEGASREWMIVIWYPGEPGRRVEAPWMPDAFVDGESFQLAEQSKPSPQPLTLAQARDLIRGIHGHSLEGAGGRQGEGRLSSDPLRTGLHDQPRIL